MSSVLAGLGWLLLGALPTSGLSSAAPGEYPGVYLATFQGHTDKILCLAISSGGLLATGGADNTLRLWDTESGSEKMVLGHDAPVTSLAFSNDGRRLATGDARSHVQLWDVPSGVKTLALPGIAGKVRQIAFAEKNVAALGDRSGILWEAATGTKVLGFDGRFALSPDDRTLALARADGSVQVLYLSEKKVNTRIDSHKEPVFAMAFSPDGQMLATAAFAGGPVDTGRDKSIKLWEVATGKPLATLVGHARGVYSLTFSPDGKRLLAVDYNGSMKLWGTRSRTLRALLEKVRKGNQLLLTTPGQWAIGPDLKTWAVGAGREVQWLDISEFGSPH